MFQEMTLISLAKIRSGVWDEGYTGLPLFLQCPCIRGHICGFFLVHSKLHRSVVSAVRGIGLVGKTLQLWSPVLIRTWTLICSDKQRICQLLGSCLLSTSYATLATSPLFLFPFDISLAVGNFSFPAGLFCGEDRRGGRGAGSSNTSCSLGL